MDKGAFDAKYWNFRQVIAWVLWRDRTIMQQADGSVWDFDALPPNDIRFALWNGFKGYPYFQSHEEVERQIINKMCAGKVDAYGVPNGRGDIQPINSRRWSDLVIRWDKGEPYAAPTRSGRAGAAEWALSEKS